MRADTVVLPAAVTTAAQRARAENARRILDIGMLAIPFLDQKNSPIEVKPAGTCPVSRRVKEAGSKRFLRKATKTEVSCSFGVPTVPYGECPKRNGRRRCDGRSSNQGNQRSELG